MYILLLLVFLLLSVIYVWKYTSHSHEGLSSDTNASSNPNCSVDTPPGQINVQNECTNVKANNIDFIKLNKYLEKLQTIENSLEDIGNYCQNYKLHTTVTRGDALTPYKVSISKYEPDDEDDVKLLYDLQTIHFVVPVGATGATGPPGPIGVPGEQGPVGPVGIVGERGPF